MWRERIVEVLSQIGRHPAWGVQHCVRVYNLAMQLAGQVGADEEVIFAASMSHDFGAYPPYRLPGSDHAARSAQVAVPFLVNEGFPVQKMIPLQQAILGHMYDVEPAETIEAQLIHDSDTLDFLGAIGIIRQVLLVGRPEGYDSLSAALARARQHAHDLPSRVITPAGRRMAEARRDEMLHFLASIDAESAPDALLTQLRLADIANTPQ